MTAMRTLGQIERLDRSLLELEAPAAARGLLGALLVRELAVANGEHRRVVARIVETEAYREQDPASHSHRGRTPRCDAMFAAPGTAYVYRSFGVHWCLNVSAEEAGRGAAVLLRAAIVLEGLEHVQTRRPRARSDRDLLRGPGCLTAGIEVDGPRHDRSDLIAGEAGLRLATDGWRPAEIVAGPRVGIRAAWQTPWRFHLRGVPEVSSYRAHPAVAGDRGGPPRGG